MSEPQTQPKEEKSHARYWWLLLFVLVLAMAGAAIDVLSRKNSANPVHVKFVEDQNGNPRLFGIPLSNTSIRDKTFSALSAMGFKGILVVRPATTNLHAENNAIETLKSMSRAGLFQTNSPAHPIPSPFE